QQSTTALVILAIPLGLGVVITAKERVEKAPATGIPLAAGARGRDSRGRGPLAAHESLHGLGGDQAKHHLHDRVAQETGDPGLARLPGADATRGRRIATQQTAERSEDIVAAASAKQPAEQPATTTGGLLGRSEEHTSELQSRENLVCRLLLEKKKSRCGGPSRWAPAVAPAS